MKLNSMKPVKIIVVCAGPVKPLASDATSSPPQPMKPTTSMRPTRSARMTATMPTMS